MIYLLGGSHEILGDDLYLIQIRGRLDCRKQLIEQDTSQDVQEGIIQAPITQEPKPGRLYLNTIFSQHLQSGGGSLRNASLATLNQNIALVNERWLVVNVHSHQAVRSQEILDLERFSNQPVFRKKDLERVEIQQKNSFEIKSERDRVVMTDNFLSLQLDLKFEKKSDFFSVNFKKQDPDTIPAPVYQKQFYYHPTQPMIYSFSQNQVLKIYQASKLSEPENIYDMIQIGEEKIIALICAPSNSGRDERQI